MRFKYYLVVILYFLIFTPTFSEILPKTKNISTAESDSVQANISFLRKFFITNKVWHSVNPEFSENIEGLLHFVQDQPIDSILNKIKKQKQYPTRSFVTRLPEDVDDTLNIIGFVPSTQARGKLWNIEKSVISDYRNRDVLIPYELLENVENKVQIIPPEKGLSLFRDSVYVMPDSLKFLDAVPDSMMQTVEDFQRILRLDSIRNAYIETQRKIYNDSIIRHYRDSVILAYRNNFIQNKIDLKKKQLSDSIKLNNYMVIKAYNDSIVKMVNDSVANAIQVLANYADAIDTSQVWFKNIKNETFPLLLSKNQRFTRVWLKNEQNDSLSVLIKTLDKNNMQMLLDDGVTFTRFVQNEAKPIDFESYNPEYGLEKIQERYKIETPWSLGGNGNFGFTQTYLSDWKKGGESAISFLTVLKGSAIYSQKKLKWENNAEIRNGWIRTGGKGEKIRKNDDKFEITSRVGLSAFKKWFYSAEIDFETQFFNGYNYPNRTTPISGFLSPSRTLLKVGMDYKPNNDLSVFISPFTAKLVAVRDTSEIDQTKFGIEKGKKSFWEPGLNADIKFKKEIAPNITYQSKYKMFINYTAPFKKFDINWENLVTMQLTNRINMQMMLHLIYDDNVLFPETKIIDGIETTISKTKVQVKELITVGFTYKINKKIYKARNLQ